MDVNVSLCNGPYYYIIKDHLQFCFILVASFFVTVAGISVALELGRVQPHGFLEPPVLFGFRLDFTAVY